MQVQVQLGVHVPWPEQKLRLEQSQVIDTHVPLWHMPVLHVVPSWTGTQLPFAQVVHSAHVTLAQGFGGTQVPPWQVPPLLHEPPLFAAPQLPPAHAWHSGQLTPAQGSLAMQVPLWQVPPVQSSFVQQLLFGMQVVPHSF